MIIFLVTAVSIIVLLYIHLEFLLRCHCISIHNSTKVSSVCFVVQADAVVDMIGFPEFVLNATALDERYEEVCILYW